MNWYEATSKEIDEAYELHVGDGDMICELDKIESLLEAGA